MGERQEEWIQGKIVRWIKILLIDAPPWREFVSTPSHERSEYRLFVLERKEFVGWNGARAVVIAIARA